MASVTINAPKTPVTEGNNGTAAATVPNVCKMPGPPAPFVPTPLPNIGRSGISPKGYSVKVRIEGSRVAIRGATFGSQGDIAAKASGGGIVSASVEGLTKFVGPGSLDVRIEGKNVQLLGDPMLNNCGPSGAPANAATLTGIVTPTGSVIAVPGKEDCPLCGKKHEPLAESEATQADASTLKTMFTLATQPRVDPQTGERRAPGSTATMLGVVHGKCGAKRYGGQSGMVHKELFEAAKASGLESLGADGPSYFPPEGVSNRAHKAVINAAKAKAIAAVKEGMLARVGAGHQEAFEKVWRKAEEAAQRRPEQDDKAKYASYPPGRCAAQKTLLLARDQGCFPGAMTELWHHPRGDATEGIILHYSSMGVLDDKTRFGDGKSVPPCGTCSTLLPYLLCPGDEPPVCQHKSAGHATPSAATPLTRPSPPAAPAAPIQSSPPPPAPPTQAPVPASPSPETGPFRGGGGSFSGGGASGDW